MHRSNRPFIHPRWVKPGHPKKDTIVENQTRRNDMENLIQLWLNPVNLGIFFLCFTVGIWILAHSDPTRRDK